MKRLIFLLLFCLFFCGCEKEVTPPSVRVVTGIQVELHQNGKVLERSYTKRENIQAVLNYLRILKPFGPVIPEGEAENGCRITLHYSYGPDSVYLQKGNDYLCCDGESWESIDSSKATLLYPMLLLLPSDKGTPPA